MPSIEPSRVAGHRPDGSKILLPETETCIRNRKSGFEYSCDEDAIHDVNNPNTDTTEEDIERSTTLRILQGEGSAGASG